MLNFILLNTLLSLAFAFFIRKLLPKRQQAQRWTAIAFFTVLGVMLPLFGIICALAIAFFNKYSTNQPARHWFRKVGKPEPLESTGTTGPQFGEGGTKVVLETPSMPLEVKIKALLALRAFNDPQSNDLFRRRLGDRDDEVRLLAYSFLNEQEVNITNEVTKMTTELERCPDRRCQAEIQRYLAFLYWEQAHFNLIRGEFLQSVLESCLQYAEQALQVLSSDSGLWVLMGHAYVVLKQYNKAVLAFEKADALGALPSKTRPFLAELSFKLKNYKAVRRYLRNEPSLQDVPMLKSLVDYWCQRI